MLAYLQPSLLPDVQWLILLQCLKNTSKSTYINWNLWPASPHGSCNRVSSQCMVGTTIYPVRHSRHPASILDVPLLLSLVYPPVSASTHRACLEYERTSPAACPWSKHHLLIFCNIFKHGLAAFSLGSSKMHICPFPSLLHHPHSIIPSSFSLSSNPPYKCGLKQSLSPISPFHYGHTGVLSALPT